MQYLGSVSNYWIQISPSSSTVSVGTRSVFLNPIVLFGGGSGVGFLYFIPAGRPVPDSSMQAGTGPPFGWDLFAPMDDYTAIVDLLRNEKPIEFFFDDASPNGWALRTGGPR